GQPWAATITASDPDGDSLTFSLVTAPAGMVISETGRLEWPSAVGGAYTITVLVTDGRGGSAEQAFSLIVNRAPEISGVPVTDGQAGVEYRYAIAAADPDGDELQYTLAGAPPGMAVDGAGVVTWPVPAGGEYTLVLRVEDGKGGAAEQSFVL